MKIADFPLTVARRATDMAPAAKLLSGIPGLDQFLEGGLPCGAVTEWGLPWGCNGRRLLLSFLRPPVPSVAALLTLWVYDQASTVVYPPAWQARGVDLSRIRFARSAHPISELKPVFMEPLFKIIVLDAPRQLDPEAMAFIGKQARLNGQTILLLRNRLLTHEQGNVWARLRLNCWREEGGLNRYLLQSVRGLSPRQMALALTDSDA